MKDELIVLTHNDLDALGCMLCIENKFPDTKKKYFHTNYGDLDRVVTELDLYVKENGNVNIIIPDVSFSTNKDALRKIYGMFSGFILHIDHHMYPDGFWDEFPKMKVVYDKTKCATLLCFETFDIKNQNLQTITKIIDVYDLWQTESPIFNIAQDLNEYFWNKNRFCDMFSQAIGFIDRGYKLPRDFDDTVQMIKYKIEQEIAESYQKKLIHRFGDISVVFAKEWFNQIMIREMDAGQNFVIGFSSWGLVKIRINQKFSSTEKKNKIREILTGEPDIGHMEAFSYKMKSGKSFENIMKEAEHVVKTIAGVCHED